ncbi:MAG: ABC transporter substrate-binding protein [Gaiellales bacterium]
MRRRPGLWLTLGALAAGVVLLGAAGCGSSNSGGSNAAGSGNTSAIPPHQNGGTIKIALAGNIDYLDPALAYYQSTWQIEYSTCVKLTNYPDLPGDAGRVITPEAASALPTISGDGLTYTYTVPAGKFKFNTGEPVTAATFQHALERDMNPKQASYFGAVFLAPFIKGASDFKGKPGEHVSGITVSGDQLTIQLTQKDGSMVQKLSTPFACAIPNDTPVDPKGVHTIAGAGPYYISDFTPNRSIVLKKNPNYTGDRPAYADEIDYSQLTIDTNQGTLEAKNGQLDYINDAVVPAQNAQLNAQYGPDGTAGGPQRFYVTPAAVVSYLALNTARPTFKDELVRQAVNWAINRKAILQPSGYGAGVPADKYLPPQISGSSEEQSIYPLDSADLTKAKALMQQAGASNLTAVLYTCNQPPCPDRAAIIQQELKQIGIDVQVKEFDRGVQFTKEGQKGEPFDIADEGWIADYYDAYDFINILLNGETIPDTGGNNFSYFNDPTFNKRMDDANQLTGSQRDQTYGQLATDLAKTAAPWASRSFGTNIDFFGPKIGCQVNQGSYGFALNTFCLRS